MPSETLQSIAQKLVANYKGLLAADESVPTATKRLESIGLESTEETRRQDRNLFLTTEGIENYISGVILFEETLGQSDSHGTPFVELLQQKGIIPGIKVDKGAVEKNDYPGEKFTEGLDGLAKRFQEYYALGARFSKWRAIITIGDSLPTDHCIEENAKSLASYAALAQAAGIVPVIEPEVLITGDHDIKRSEEVTTQTVKTTFDELKKNNVDLSATILKTSMVISGDKCPTQATSEEIGAATVRFLKNSVPDDVPGVVFLSGGQTGIQATENLNAVHKFNPGPWQVSFSYARALQGDPLKVWAGQAANIPAAQTEFIKRMKGVHAANQGQYTAEMEN